MTQTITNFIAENGYMAIAILMFLESACIPIPSEVTMLFGGALANETFVKTVAHSPHHLNLFVVGLIGAIANLPWTFTLAAAGYALGSHWTTVESISRPLTYAIVVFGVVYVMWRIARQSRQTRTAV